MRLLLRTPWLLLLLLLIAAAWSLRPFADTDIPWHLRTGQWMLAHGDVIRHDVFSATRLGCDWVSVPWLYQVMLAKLHAAWGWSGPTLWQVLMVLGITLQTAFLCWLLRRTGAGNQADAAARVPPGCDTGRWDWQWPFLSVPAALSVLLMLRLLQARINGRPELFTYLFIGSYLIVLSLGTRPQAADDRRQASVETSTLHLPPSTRHFFLWLLPLLQVLWTNLHGAFILGPAIVWAYAAGAWLAWLAARRMEAHERPVDPDGLAPETEGEWPRHRAGPAPWRLSLVAALTTLACLATPYGLAGTFYPFHLFQVLTDPLYKNGIVEGRPVELSAALDSGALGYAFLACWVLAGLGALGRLMETFRRNGELAVNSDQLPVTSEPCRPARLLTAHCSLLTFSRSGPALGYAAACAAMAYLSLSAVRNVPLLILAAAPLVASGLEYAADGAGMLVLRSWSFVLRSRGVHKAQLLASPTKHEEQSTKNIAALALLHSRGVHLVAQFALALFLLGCYRAIVSERFYASLGWRMRVAAGFSDHEHPLAACRFVEQNRSNLVSRTLYGDTRSANLFLLRFGPARPVYFDGRHAEIYDPPIFRAATRTRWNVDAFTNAAAQYGIGLACFSLTDLKEDRCPLAVALGQTNTWHLVYLDDCAALFAANTPTNAALVRCFGLSAAPTNAAEQRIVFAGWLDRQGRASLRDLDDPANRALEQGELVTGVINTLQLSGLWAPERHLEPLRFCRLAAFLDHLGWTVVADDVYQQTLRWPREFPVTLPRAIRHARRVAQEVQDPILRTELLARMRQRAEELRRMDPASPVAAAALEELRTNDVLRAE
jgi:hypothetical protein